MSRTHGTLVSEIVARSGARLTIADVFGVDGDNRLIAPAAAIASAIDWMVANGVRVINISIEGPDNFVLAHVIKRALAADVAIVAAAGNGGPAGGTGVSRCISRRHRGHCSRRERGQVYPTRQSWRLHRLRGARRTRRVGVRVESSKAKTCFRHVVRFAGRRSGNCSQARRNRGRRWRDRLTQERGTRPRRAGTRCNIRLGRARHSESIDRQLPPVACS